MYSLFRHEFFPLALAFLLACLLRNQTVYATVSTRITNSLVFLFTFTEGQSNASASLTLDRSTATLSTSVLPTIQISNISGQWIPARQGLDLTGAFATSGGTTLVGVDSSTSVSGVINALYSSFSVEVWISTADLLHSGMIVGFGSWDPTVNTLTESNTVCIGQEGSITQGVRDWQFAQTDRAVSLILSHASPSAGCSVITVNLNSSAVYHHLVGTVFIINSTTATVQLFHNGLLANSSTVPQMPFAQWQDGNRVQISSEQMLPLLPGHTWQGSLFLLSMYSSALTAAEVAINYQSGLPNSQPVLAVLLQTVTVLQDSNLTLFSSLLFNASDFDNDSLSIRILVLPLHGSLYLCSNSVTSCMLITAVSLPYFFHLPTLYVTGYSPPPASWGIDYDSFSYSAWDGSAASVPATVSINVQHIVIPPLPNNMNVIVFASNTVLLSLTGTDVDSSAPLNSPMTNISIVSLPTQGQLYQYTPSAPLSIAVNISNTPVSSSTFSVVYRSTTPLTATGGLSYMDQITFVVQTKGTWSVAIGVVNITVLNPLLALPITTSLISNSPLSITLQGSSQLIQAVLLYYVVSLPTEGILTTAAGLQIVPYNSSNSSVVLSTNTVSVFSSPLVVFTTSVSIYAGLYNRSLDPVNDSFTYGVMDTQGDAAAVVTAVILYPAIHHAAIISVQSDNYQLNTTEYNVAAAAWSVIPSVIVDPDALPGSAWSLVAFTFPAVYHLVVSVLPVSGALIRLDPSRTAVVQVVSGSVSGSASLSFSGVFASCNAVLAGLQFQANTANIYNVTVAATQADTGNTAQQSIIVQALSVQSQSVSCTGSNEGGDNNESSSSLFSLTSKWLWIIIGCACGVVLFVCASWEWKRRVKRAEQRKREITNVAVELAKAVSAEKTASNEAEQRAAEKAATVMQQTWMDSSMRSPRLMIAVNDSLANAQSLSCLHPRQTSRFFLTSPRTPGANYAAPPVYYSPRAEYTTEQQQQQQLLAAMQDEQLQQKHQLLQESVNSLGLLSPRMAVLIPGSPNTSSLASLQHQVSSRPVYCVSPITSTSIPGSQRPVSNRQQVQQEQALRQASVFSFANPADQVCVDGVFEEDHVQLEFATYSGM